MKEDLISHFEKRFHFLRREDENVSSTLCCPSSFYSCTQDSHCECVTWKASQSLGRNSSRRSDGRSHCQGSEQETHRLASPSPSTTCPCSLSAGYILWKKNMLADQMNYPDQVLPTEWSLRLQSFDVVCEVYGHPHVDLFATSANTKFPLYVYPVSDRMARK